MGSKINNLKRVVDESECEDASDSDTEVFVKVENVKDELSKLKMVWKSLPGGEKHDKFIWILKSQMDDLPFLQDANTQKLFTLSEKLDRVKSSLSKRSIIGNQLEQLYVKTAKQKSFITRKQWFRTHIEQNRDGGSEFVYDLLCTETHRADFASPYILHMIQDVIKLHPKHPKNGTLNQYLTAFYNGEFGQNNKRNAKMISKMTFGSDDDDDISDSDTEELKRKMRKVTKKLQDVITYIKN